MTAPGASVPKCMDCDEPVRPTPERGRFLARCPRCQRPYTIADLTRMRLVEVNARGDDSER